MAHHQHVPLDQPAYYCITVLGHLDKELTYRLSDLELRELQTEQGQECCMLSGMMGDQAALIGVLVQLYNRGLCLVALERKNARQPDQEQVKQ